MFNPITRHFANQRAILALLGEIKEQGIKQMAAIDDIAADEALEDAQITNVITLLGELEAAIANAGVDPTKLAAVRADIQGKTAALQAAITANPVPGAAPPATS